MNITMPQFLNFRKAPERPQQQTSSEQGPESGSPEQEDRVCVRAGEEFGRNCAIGCLG